jgi:hypothetical protein
MKQNWFLLGVGGLVLSGCAAYTAISDSDLVMPLPLPVITPAAPDLSPKTAAFLGTWEGRWDGVLAARLIV